VRRCYFVVYFHTSMVCGVYASWVGFYVLYSFTFDSIYVFHPAPHSTTFPTVVALRVLFFRSIPFFVFLVLSVLVIVGVYRVSRIATRQFPCLIPSAHSGLSVQIESRVRRRVAGNMLSFFWRWKRNLVSFSSAGAFFQI